MHVQVNSLFCIFPHNLLCLLTLVFTLVHSSPLSPPKCPDVYDWNEVIFECRSLAAHWELLSAYLGLSKEVIDRIRSKKDYDCRWNEALHQWIEQNYQTERFGLPSWRTLLKAVAIVDRRLFKQLADLHSGICMYIMLGAYEGIRNIWYIMVTSKQNCLQIFSFLTVT